MTKNTNKKALILSIRAFVISIVLFLKLAKVEGREVILGSFGSSYELNGAVLLEEKFSRAEFSVVVISHRKTVSACVVNIDQFVQKNEER